ncbi:MAG: hypothetical protein ACQESR_18085 [Planctomycetota bacterium]
MSWQRTDIYLYLMKAYPPGSDARNEIAQQLATLLNMRWGPEEMARRRWQPELGQAAAALALGQVLSCTMYYDRESYEGYLFSQAARRTRRYRVLPWREVDPEEKEAGAQIWESARQWIERCVEVRETLRYLILLTQPVWTCIYLIMLPAPRSGWQGQLARFLNWNQSSLSHVFQQFDPVMGGLDAAFEEVMARGNDASPLRQQLDELVGTCVAECSVSEDSLDDPETLRPQLARVILDKLPRLGVHQVSAGCQFDALKDALKTVPSSLQDSTDWTCEAIADLCAESCRPGSVARGTTESALLRFLGKLDLPRHNDPAQVLMDIAGWRRGPDVADNGTAVRERIPRNELIALLLSQLEPGSAASQILIALIQGTRLDDIRACLDDYLPPVEETPHRWLERALEILRLWKERWQQRPADDESLWLDMPWHLRRRDLDATTAISEIDRARDLVDAALQNPPATWDELGCPAEHVSTSQLTLQSAVFIAILSDLHDDLRQTYEANKAIKKKAKAARRVNRSSGHDASVDLNQNTNPRGKLVEIVLEPNWESDEFPPCDQVRKKVRWWAGLPETARKQGMSLLPHAIDRQENPPAKTPRTRQR